MCIIAVSEGGARMTEEIFKECFRCNRDGFGVVYHDGENVHMIKGIMDVETALTCYNSIPEGKPHIAHFRIASVGGVCPDLTHPFIMTPDSPIIYSYTGKDSFLFHNGTYSGYQSMLLQVMLSTGKHPEGKISDSRVIACGIGLLKEWEGKKMMADLISGKIALISPTEIYRNAERWEEHESIYYSNTSYRVVSGARFYQSNFLEGSDMYGATSLSEDRNPAFDYWRNRRESTQRNTNTKTKDDDKEEDRKKGKKENNFELFKRSGKKSTGKNEKEKREAGEKRKIKIIKKDKKGNVTEKEMMIDESTDPFYYTVH